MPRTYLREFFATRAPRRESLKRPSRLRARPLFTLIVAALLAGGLTTKAVAEDCAGLFDAANKVTAEYNDYDVAENEGNVTPKLKRQVWQSIDALHTYISGYLTAQRHMSNGIDDETALSQCDPDTRASVYKADVQTVVFATRIGYKQDKKVLDQASYLLKNFLLVLQKTNIPIGAEIKSLTDYLKTAYRSEHLSMPQELLDVDSSINSSH